MTTLFVRAGALGDFVVTLPVLERLLAEGPVDVACAPRFHALLPLVPGGDRAGRRWDVGGHDLLWLFGGADPVGYTRAVVFSRRAAEGARAAGIPDVRWVDAVPLGPAADHFGAVLGLRGAIPRLVVPDALPPRILLAPGASDPARLGAPAWWHALADALGDLRPTWVLGPAEADADWPGPAVRPGLVETARWAARSVWVGADSGPGHLAAAAGARVLTRFVTTDPRVWAPPGGTVVTAGATPEEVAAGVRAAWKSIVADDSGGASG